MTITQPTEEMADREYFSAPGLSNSGMRDLAVSPYRYWWLHINPNRKPVEPTPEMEFGSALHCLILEPMSFGNRYCCALSPEDIEGCLRTIDDMRAWLKSKGHTPSGKLKADIMAQVLTLDPCAPVWDVIESEHGRQNAGKKMFSKEDWDRLHGAKRSVMCEPHVERLLSVGRAEVPYFVSDPVTGVPLKAKMDWVRPECTVDLKTFTQKRGKSIDKSVTDAIFYEQYNRQAFFYTALRTIAEKRSTDFVMIFIESVEPYEVRIRSLRPKTATEINLYWEKARVEVRDHIRTYQECSEQYGTDPWRWPRDIDPLCDEEMPQLAY